MRQRRFLIRLPAALTVLAFLLVQTGCSGLLPRQTDAAEEAILRVAALSRAGEELTLTAMTTGIKTGESSEPPETLEGSGKNYEEAWRDITQRREASLVHCTDWVVEENAFQDLLDACLRDPEVTYAAKVYLLQDQTVSDFLDAFAEEETGPARSLADLDRAMGDAGVTLLECSALLAEGKSCEIPVLRAENGKLKVTGEVTVEEWR